MELKLADKEEDKWRRHSERVLKRYAGESGYNADLKRVKDTFNILWSNTETLLPSLYSQTPKPDVRRRFRDKDKIGKLASTLVERCLSFSLDNYDFDATIRKAVLDYLLPGRGVVRVDYVPSFGKEPLMGADGQQVMQDDEPVYPKTYEAVQCRPIKWDDFRRGPGCKWSDVPWIAFRSEMTRDELVGAFGEKIGNEVELNDPENDDIKKEDDSEVKGVYKTAEVWEIWDRDKRQVIYICKTHKQAPLKVSEDPLNLEGFYPIPEPIVSIERPGSLVPTPEFLMYETLADELDRVTGRINKIIRGLKLRGVYDATISEFSKLFSADDNELIAAENAIALMEKGGLEKSVWMLPIEKPAQVLVQLYQYRETLKQAIYEITGISDVIRGATNAAETATAQQLKSQWGTLRLQRRQKDIQRFVRDILRIKAEIISEKFDIQTLAMISGMKLPMPQEKAMAQMQAQAMSAMGQEVPPEVQNVLMMPGWDEVVQVIKDDAMRSFRIDIETDSTIATQLEADRKDVAELVGGLGQFAQSFGPAVQTGFIPGEVAKTILMSLVRKFKLGNDVEDAVEGMEAKAIAQDPQAMQQQIEQAQQQYQQAMQEVQQAQQQVEAGQQALQQEKLAIDEEKRALEYDKGMLKVQKEAAAKNMQAEFATKKAEMQIAEKDIQAAIADLERVRDEADASAKENDDKSVENEGKEAELAKMVIDTVSAMQEQHKEMLGVVSEAIKAMTAPKKVVRDKSGRVERVVVEGD